MNRSILLSDQSLTWSAHGRSSVVEVAQASRPVAAANAGSGHAAQGLAHRALQALRQTWLQMCRRPRSWSQVLSVRELSRAPAANGLRAPGRLRRRDRTSGELSPSPRDHRGDLRDQPRTLARPRGALRGGGEQVVAATHPKPSIRNRPAYSSPTCSRPGSPPGPRCNRPRRPSMNPKITPQHLSKPAYIYIRQSTQAQVLHHQESTERQYAWKDKALALGWTETAIRTLDRDLGHSGAQMTGREDFKTLVADVSMGQVGAVFALEVSRLARSNLDWHRLLELCALTHTLVIDADGVYDPGDFNDGLLLGLKGTMAQAELHFLRGRLQGGKLNKAQKGELRFPLPVGLCYDDEGRIVLDPDDEVRGAVQLVFRLFRETGSAYAVVKRFAEDGFRFPKRAYGGAWAGKLIWGRLSHGRVLGLIRNPSYAGVYVFGRYQYRQRITSQGEVHKRLQPVPKADWRVHLPGHHEGYITS